MAKPKLQTEIVTVEIKVPYNSYSNKELNKKARSEIKRWIKETVEDELSFITMYVEKDPTGGAIEDCSKKTTIKIRSMKQPTWKLP